jgi:hypothetical protein
MGEIGEGSPRWRGNFFAVQEEEEEEEALLKSIYNTSSHPFFFFSLQYTHTRARISNTTHLAR